MDDVYCKVQVIRRGAKLPVVVVSMLQPDGTFYRESQPLDPDSNIKDVVQAAFKSAEKAHQNHLIITTNPLNAPMGAGVE